MTKLTYLVLFLFFTFAISAQSTFQPKQVDGGNKGIIYNQELAVGVRVHTNGFALGVDIGKLKTYYLTQFIHFEIGELKHNREVRQSFDFPSSLNGKVSRAFKFGKQNNLYVLRAGFGHKRYFSEKAKKKGVAVGLTYQIGPTLGLLKPYYLELFPSDNSPDRLPVSTKYSDAAADRFLNIWNIYGASTWTKGLDELAILPGVHAKIAMHFDWGAFDEYIKAFEAGIMLDVFTKKAPIMVEIDGIENRPFFLNLFLNIQFGKRW
ncbi:MAG: hypothetical protein NXI23_05285 [Bacteroidetes bacterium]|jgi:hypothetical protein|nr:hypothetical protein [Bacteroidota bacterium]MDF1863181.1 hypothetical protein [Saprospiraceae bacterium]